MMKNTILIFVISMLGICGLSAQQSKDEVMKAPKSESKAPNTWKKLSKITFKKQYDEMTGFKVDVPVFSEEVKAMDGTEITIKGYIIPVEGYKSHKEFVFSAYPYDMCFFCGKAGPETVMEVFAKDGAPVDYSEQSMTLKGTFRFRSSDVNDIMFKLEEAELVEE